MALKLKPENSEDIYSWQKCSPPKFNNRSYRSWDYNSVLIDDYVNRFWYDTTWGWYYYLEYKGQWYKHRIVYDRKNTLFGKQPDLENHVGYMSKFEVIK